MSTPIQKLADAIREAAKDPSIRLIRQSFGGLRDGTNQCCGMSAAMMKLNGSVPFDYMGPDFNGFLVRDWIRYNFGLTRQQIDDFMLGWDVERPSFSWESEERELGWALATELIGK